MIGNPDFSLADALGRHVALLAALVMMSAHSALAACNGTAFAPADHPVMSLELQAEGQGDQLKVTAGTLGLDPFAGSVHQTPDAISRGLQQKKNLLAVDLATGQANGRLVFTDAKVTVFYPTTLQDAPRVTVTAGDLERVATAQRQPDMPNLADVYADFSLSPADSAKFGPGATFDLAVTSASGILLETASFRMPDAPTWQGLAAEARRNLAERCAAE